MPSQVPFFVGPARHSHALYIQTTSCCKLKRLLVSLMICAIVSCHARFLSMNPTTLGYAKDFPKTDQGKSLVEKMRKDWIHTELPRFAQYLSNLMDKYGGGLWLASDGPTIADCKLIPLLLPLTRGYIDHISPHCLDDYPRLVEYMKRFCALDPIKGRYSFR
jgi:glutathione S-transferase